MERTPDGNSVSIFYFSAAIPGVAALRLAAAVVWRDAENGLSNGARRRGCVPAARLRRLRHLLWLRFGPLGFDVQWRGQGNDPRGGAAVTSVCLPADVEPRAYYDGGAVRLLDRVYKVPADGRALVLLVDEEGERAASGGRPAVQRAAVRAVLIRSLLASALPRRDQAPEDSAPVHNVSDVRIIAVTGGGRPEWVSILRSDPQVRAFMDATPDA